MGLLDTKKQSRLKRKRRIRKHLVGTGERPRFCVFRSNKQIYAQIIDDNVGCTLASASSVEKAVKDHPEFDSKVALAGFVGKLLAGRAIEKGIKKVVFDRNGFLYHGRVKAIAESAREAGLDF